jgi:transmembrane sensor
MNNFRLKSLFELYSKNMASEQEEAEFLSFAADPENKIIIQQLIDLHILTTGGHTDIAESSTSDMMQAIFSAEQSKPSVIHRVHFLRLSWFRYAAAILIVLGIGSYVFLSKKSAQKPVIVAEQNKLPGSDKAILTLSDGRQVILDNSNKENIADGSVTIEKANGVLIYNTASTAAASANEVFNTMSTPRGGQYQLFLPDGSKVWLNSASSLKYPIIFQSKNRLVELSGEAYFDIKQNKKLPFVVKTQKAEVLVLGTEFNINSYSDEPEFSATLINGSVKVSSGNDNKIIVPGQQVEISNLIPNILTINKDVDINRVIAWQKGIFKFSNISIEAVARQLTRWYDVEVKMKKGSKDLQLSGGITKKTSLQHVLKVLEANGVKHTWQNNRIELYAP